MKINNNKEIKERKKIIVLRMNFHRRKYKKKSGKLF